MKLLDYIKSRTKEFDKIAQHHEDKKKSLQAQHYAEAYWSIIEYIKKEHKPKKEEKMMEGYCLECGFYCGADQ